MLRQGVQFVTSVVLARLLLPANFGLIALVIFFSSFSSIFVQGGLPEALIQRRTSTPEEESSVFWWNIVGSILFAACLVLLGPFLGSFYRAPELPPLMTLAALLTVCAALGAVQTALLTRELRFDQLAKAGLASSVLSGATGITAAYLGAGIWALGIQMATAAVVNTAVIWWLSHWRPTRHFSLRTIRDLLRFGGWLSLSTALEILYTQGFALLLGKLYGLRELGFYNRASGTQQLPTNVFSGVIGRVAFPLLSMRNDDPAAMRAGLRQANGLVMLINIPAMVGLSLVPDLVIDVLFGAKWLPAAPILAILAWSGVIFPLHVTNLQALLSLGHSSTFFRLEIAKKIMGVTVVVVGSFFGLRGLAFAQLGAAVIALFINVAPMRRRLGYGIAAQVKDLAGVIGATAAMTAVVLLLRSTVELPATLQLTLLVVAGGGTYALAGLTVPNRNFLEALDVARTLVSRRKAGDIGAI